MRLLKLTHANHKRPVHISTNHIAGLYQGSDGSTHIISVGAIIPVQETVDEIVSLLNQTKLNEES